MFDDVDVGSLKNAINSCKNSINYKTTQRLISDVSSSSVWDASCKSNLQNSMQELITRNTDIEKKLDSYLGVASLIGEYQKLEKEEKELEADCDYYRRMIDRTEDEDTIDYYSSKLSQALKRIKVIKNKKTVILNQIKSSI